MTDRQTDPLKLEFKIIRIRNSLCLFKINIVAGGVGDEYNTLDSVELNVAGDNGWTYGSLLPKPMSGSRGVTVMSQFYITGELNH